MSLRVRLTLYFTVIVVLPLAVAAVVARTVLVRELEARAEDELQLVLRSATQQLDLVAMRAGDVTEDLAAPERELGRALAERDTTSLQAAVTSVFGGRGRVDVVAVADAQGRLLASRVAEPTVMPGVALPGVAALVERAIDDEVPPAIVGELRPVLDSEGAPLGWVLAARWVDRRLAVELQSGLPTDLTLFVDGVPVATTSDVVRRALAGRDGGPLESPAEVAAEPPVERVASAAGPALVEAVDADGRTIVASTPARPLAVASRVVTTGTVVIVAIVALTAALLGLLVAQAVVRPVEELAAAARDVARGDLSRRIDVTGGGELAVLGAAFNTMTENLRRHVTELEVSRDALQHSLDRLGQTLSSTLDLNGTLAAVVDASAAALTARRAGLFMLAPGRTHLYVKVARGLEPDEVERTYDLAAGLVGWVARSGSAARSPGGDGGTPPPAPTEPQGDAVVAAPLFSPSVGEVIGVLALYDRTDGRPFSDRDLNTLRSFAVQASVAIENVRLHEATQQASITDGLTGLANLRHFQQRAEEEVERAARFGHDLAMIVLDIDHFKAVNDRYGHPVGDEVLIEVARRVSSQVREVDTVARYGGEEIVLVLPETDLAGARRTAERIRAAVGGAPIATAAGPVVVTVSLGVAAARGEAADVTAMLQQADRAMYAAKGAGRDRVETAAALSPPHAPL